MSKTKGGKSGGSYPVIRSKQKKKSGPAKKGGTAKAKTTKKAAKTAKPKAKAAKSKAKSGKPKARVASSGTGKPKAKSTGRPKARGAKPAARTGKLGSKSSSYKGKKTASKGTKVVARGGRTTTTSRGGKSQKSGGAGRSAVKSPARSKSVVKSSKPKASTAKSTSTGGSYPVIRSKQKKKDDIIAKSKGKTTAKPKAKGGASTSKTRFGAKAVSKSVDKKYSGSKAKTGEVSKPRSKPQRKGSAINAPSTISAKAAGLGASSERIQKIIARAGVASRRKAEELITSGKVRVNGKLVTELGRRADASVDTITVNDKPLHFGQTTYYAVHKPVGFISTTAEDAERRVIDLVPELPRVVPVGRLDVESEGIMLLTNDGELTHRMTHPSFGLDRVYRVEVEPAPTEEDLAKLSRGVYLAEGKTLPPKIVVIHAGNKTARLEVTVKEGLNREVRRMFAVVGLDVKKLTRVRFGPLGLNKLHVGTYRELTDMEIKKLKAAVDKEGERPPKWLRRNRSRKPKRSRD